MSLKNEQMPKDRVSPGLDEMASILKRCGILLSRAQAEQLWTYHQLLREYNPELNLTRIHNFSNMTLKLYADSILPGRFIDLPTPLMDLGSGPGMPGIPLKIAYPHLDVILAESRGKRVEFLRMVLDRLKLKGVTVVGDGVSRGFEQPVEGVITRAVEEIGSTLNRVHGCLSRGGLVVFMKGPHCDDEIREASVRFEGEYVLVKDHPYRIPHTPHERRLVVFKRATEPPRVGKARAMDLHTARKIESEQNEVFKDLKKLLTARGIRKRQRALVSGQKVTAELLEDFSDLCEAWISRGDETPPPAGTPSHIAWFQLAPHLFETLDSFGTGYPLLLARLPEMGAWTPEDGLEPGCTVLIPFQDPENVGALVRSAVALGAPRIILLAESAHPFHPKALRASGGTVFRAKFLHGPSLRDLPVDLPVMPLSAEGANLAGFKFPGRFALLPGMEGPGLPEVWRRSALSIPIAQGVESLNAATAAAIALYVWSDSIRRTGAS